MSTSSRFLGALLAVVAAGGCATTATKSTPVRPLAEGQAVPAAEYDLRVDARPAGRVVLLAGHTIREAAHRQVVHVGLEVDNHSPREYRLPTSQLLLSSAEARNVPLVEVDENAAPALLTVPPGESRTFDLKFLLPEQPGLADLRLFQVHWTLDVDGGHAPVVRTTGFVATPRKALAVREEPKTQITTLPRLVKSPEHVVPPNSQRQAHAPVHAERTINFQ